jgi:hypothetical protein
MPRQIRIPCVVLSIAIFVLMGATGCGSSTTAPSPISSILQPGAYWLDLAGYSIDFNPEVPACVAETGSVLLSVRVRVDVALLSGVWVGRVPGEIGDLELRIHGDEEVAGGVKVSGSIAGNAVDTTSVLPRRGFLPVPDVSIKLAGAPGGSASAKGLAERTQSHISGTASGDIQFFNSLGWVSRCPAITWSLLPV